MANIFVDFTQRAGKIKPMHAVGQPPFKGGFRMLDFSPIEWLKKAHIPYSRLHDVGGAFGGNRYVDIPNIFRDFDADENDPASYDFAFTDALLAGLAEYDVKPYFRLGVTIENQCHIKTYRIHPPKDYGKWARICEHIIRHYNEGWADGFYYGIEYWEIWNEPENGPAGKNQMWTGTPLQFFELYDVAAKHLKACFGDKIKVGGYGACGFDGIYCDLEKYGIDAPKREFDEERTERYMHRLNFFLDFMDYIEAHGSPMDFFSWHCYYDVDVMRVSDSFLHRVLEEHGYGHVETHLNEWNNAHIPTQNGTSFASAAAAAVLLAMQDSHTDMLCYYDARITASAYGGFFAPLTFEPTCTYHAFAAFGALYALGDRVLCEADGVQALAAANGEARAVMVVNYSEEEKAVTTNLSADMKVYLVDREHHMTEVALDPASFTLAPNGIALLKS